MRIALIVLLLLITFFAGLTAGGPRDTRAGKNFEWKLAEALPDWDTWPSVPATEGERALYRHAIQSLELTPPPDDLNWLNIGAKKFFGDKLFRGKFGQSVTVCPPADMFDRAAAIVTRNNLLKYKIEESDLRFAARVPRPSAYVVNVVARTAFDDRPQQSEVFKDHDIRPFARTVLAGFGGKAAAFSTLAFQQMSAADSMGTGAAQVAAATGYPGALPRIEQMMRDLLAATPKDKPVPWNDKKRLYELSYALHFAGDAGRSHIAPLKELMTREVESWAPPFGMTEISPKSLCRVLELIEGRQALAPYSYCLDDKYPFDS